METNIVIYVGLNEKYFNFWLSTQRTKRQGGMIQLISAANATDLGHELAVQLVSYTVLIYALGILGVLSNAVTHASKHGVSQDDLRQVSLQCLTRAGETGKDIYLRVKTVCLYAVDRGLHIYELLSKPRIVQVGC